MSRGVKRGKGHELLFSSPIQWGGGTREDTINQKRMTENGNKTENSISMFEKTNRKYRQSPNFT